MGEVGTPRNCCIILREGRFEEGDPIVSEASGSVYSLNGEVKYNITESLDTFLQLGYQASSFEKPITKVKDIEITDEKAFDEGTSPTNFNPNSNIDPDDAKIEMNGFKFSLGIAYAF